MTALKVSFVGIRSDRLHDTVALFRDVIGVPVTRQTDDLVGFRLADGTVLRYYGANAIRKNDGAPTSVRHGRGTHRHYA
jgi:hypothetical protein